MDGHPGLHAELGLHERNCPADVVDLSGHRMLHPDAVCAAVWAAVGTCTWKGKATPSSESLATDVQATCNSCVFGWTQARKDELMQAPSAQKTFA